MQTQQPESQSCPIPSSQDEQDILRLLLADCEGVADASADLQEWRKDLAHTAWQSSLFRQCGLGAVARTTAKLYLLLLECVSSHRWQRALEVLLCVVNQPVLPAADVAKVALEIFDHNPGHEILLEQLVNQLRMVSSVDRKDLSLCYAQLLIKDRRFDEAKNQFKVNLRRRGAFKVSATASSDHIDLLFQAYQGLLDFNQWQQCWVQLSNIMADDDNLTFDAQAEYSYQKMQLSNEAENALQRLRGLENQPGLWDIFINKTVQLYEFQENLDSALDVLRTYAEKNPDNPNCILQLYQFHVRHGADIDQRLQALQKFCDAVPSHELALTLHSMLIEKGTPAGQCVYLLFDLLDYPCWATCNEAWQTLSDQLSTIATSGGEECVTELQSSWQHRQDWWPDLHFNSLRPDLQVTDQCAVAKTLVAVMLLGPENRYTQKMLENDSSEETAEQIREAELYHNVLIKR